MAAIAIYVTIFLISVNSYFRTGIFYFDYYAALEFALRKCWLIGLCYGTGNWLMIRLQERRELKRGKEAIDILARYGYRIEINDYYKGAGVILYKINGDSFYNYLPIMDRTLFITQKLTRIVKKLKHDNIIINLADSNVDVDKLKQELLKKPINGLKKFIIIDQYGYVYDFTKNQHLLSDSDSNILYLCPCCFNRTIKKQGKWEDCPICHWIDDPFQSLDMTSIRGKNKMSLKQAREVYRLSLSDGESSIITKESNFTKRPSLDISVISGIYPCPCCQNKTIKNATEWKFARFATGSMIQLSLLTRLLPVAKIKSVLIRPEKSISSGSLNQRINKDLLKILNR